MLMLLAIKNGTTVRLFFRHPASVGCFFFASCKTFARVSANYLCLPQSFREVEIMDSYEILRMLKIAGYTVVAGSFGLAFLFLCFAL